MIDLNQLMVFIRVVENGSFAGAARILGMPRATVSRKVSQLEGSLNVRLLQRSTRKLSLTEAGRNYYLTCSNALTEIDLANQTITEIQQSPSGLLRIAAPLSAQSGFMNEWINEFLALHPTINTEVLLSDNVVDLIEEGIDVAFRAGTLQDSSLVARKLGKTKLVLCASPDYLQKAPGLRSLKDLKQHQCICFATAKKESSWRLLGKQGLQTVYIQSRVMVNSMEFALNTCLAGLGVALLPVGLVSEHINTKRLTILLERYASEANGLFLVYPSKRHLPLTTRTFLDFIIDKAEEGLPWNELL